jgi:hypothetical protein
VLFHFYACKALRAADSGIYSLCRSVVAVADSILCKASREIISAEEFQYRITVSVVEEICIWE